MKSQMPTATYHNERIDDVGGAADAVEGQVALSHTKLFWVGGMFLISVIGGVLTFSLSALAVFIILTGLSLCLGHSLGMHRRLIHNSYQCPKWLEYFFVHLGVIVGLAGPMGMIRTHDMRDWAQRQDRCHDYFGHQQPILIDAYWQMFCDIRLKHSPVLKIEADISRDRVYKFMERTWMLQQLPWACVLFLAGGLAWVVWGVCMRVSVSILGHWLVGYFAHNTGGKHWLVQGACVQGYNIKCAALITMGESWHNNHHAFPGSAKLGIYPGELDPGWIVIKGLRRLGLVWNIKVPESLPPRPELKAVGRLL